MSHSLGYRCFKSIRVSLPPYRLQHTRMITFLKIVVAALLILFSIELRPQDLYAQTSSPKSETPSKFESGEKNGEKQLDDATRAKIQERDELDKQFKELVVDRKIDEALPLGEKWLALERSISGNESQSIDGKLRRR